jgi:hypothetical protein
MRYLSSIFLREDETCFYLFEAASADDVAEAAASDASIRTRRGSGI